MSDGSYRQATFEFGSPPQAPCAASAPEQIAPRARAGNKVNTCFDTQNRHTRPSDPAEFALPFFFWPLKQKAQRPQLVDKSQQLFGKTIKDYVCPLSLPQKGAINSYEKLRLFVPESTYPYLRSILDCLNIVVIVKDPRKTIAGDCRLHRLENFALITVNEFKNKFKFLTVLLHEIAHALNHKQITAHDYYWKSIYSCLLADFYDFYPDELKQEVLWGMVYTPAASRDTNFGGKAFLFGVQNESDPEPQEHTQQSKAPLPKPSVEKPVDFDHSLEGLVENLNYDFSYDERQVQTLPSFYHEHELYIPLELRGDRIIGLLHAMNYRARYEVLRIYGHEYGEGPRRYAENTLSDWAHKNVSCQLTGRLFSVVPMVFPLSRKKELCKIILSTTDAANRLWMKRHYKSPRTYAIAPDEWSEKKGQIEKDIRRHGEEEAKSFEYEAKYNYKPIYPDLLWLRQSEMVEYRKELSKGIREAAQKALNGVTDKIQALSRSVSSTKRGELCISFHDIDFQITVKPTLGYYFRRFLAIFR